MGQTGGQAASVFGASVLTWPLWPHQQRALAAFELDRQRGNAATYLVVPPGGGKTLIGLEVARRLGRPATESVVFTTALDEVLSPLAQPRYVIQRLIIKQPEGLGAALRLAIRRLIVGHLPAAVVYHAVPTVLGGKKQLAEHFERAWNVRVSPGEILYTGSPEGAGILTVQRGDDPFAVTTQIRTLWR